jgi:hypothetical protein
MRAGELLMTALLCDKDAPLVRDLLRTRETGKH